MNIGLEDTLAYYSPEEFELGFKKTMAFQPRVIKQNRGSSGEGIWSLDVRREGFSMLFVAFNLMILMFVPFYDSVAYSITQSSSRDATHRHRIIKLKEGNYCSTYGERSCEDSEKLVLMEANDNHEEAGVNRESKSTLKPSLSPFYRPISSISRLYLAIPSISRLYLAYLGYI